MILFHSPIFEIRFRFVSNVPVEFEKLVVVVVVRRRTQFFMSCIFKNKHEPREKCILLAQYNFPIYKLNAFPNSINRLGYGKKISQFSLNLWNRWKICINFYTYSIHYISFSFCLFIHHDFYSKYFKTVQITDKNFLFYNEKYKVSECLHNFFVI